MFLNNIHSCRSKISEAQVEGEEKDGDVNAKEVNSEHSKLYLDFPEITEEQKQRIIEVKVKIFEFC